MADRAGQCRAESGALVGIAADNDGAWDPDIHPEKFLPGGNRRTIGYALASTFPRVAQEALRRQVAQVGGMCKSIDAKLFIPEAGRDNRLYAGQRAAVGDRGSGMI